MNFQFIFQLSLLLHASWALPAFFPMIYSAFYVLMPISLIINFLCRFLHLIKTGNCWKICSLTFAVDDIAATFSDFLTCFAYSIEQKSIQWPSAKQKSSNWVMKCKTNLFWTPMPLQRQQTRQTRQTRQFKAAAPHIQWNCEYWTFQQLRPELSA